MPDVKKLITGFLILAAGASSSAFILSNIGSSSGAVVSPAAEAAPTPSPTLGDNAFVPEPIQDNAAALTDDTATTTDDDPNNVTNNLADAFVGGIITSNPDGPQQDSSGNVQFVSPDAGTVSDVLQSAPGLSNMTPPNWDVEVGVLQNEVKIVPDSTSTIFTYLATLNQINTNELVQSGLSNAAANSNTDTSSIFATAGPHISNMLSDAAALSVPSELVNFHKSYLKMLVYEKNEYLLVAGISQGDPAKTALILQYEQANYNQAIQDFTNQTQTLLNSIALNNQSPRQNAVTAFVDDIFSIHTAQAQWLTTDPLQHVTTWLTSTLGISTQWATYLAGLAQDIVIQIVKNTLMAVVQKKIMVWIQGSGAPRFIQNWGTTLVNAYTAQAISALNGQMACVGPTLAPNLKILLATPRVGSTNSYCSNVFNSLLNAPNFKQLSTRFTNFNDYFALYQPGGNMWGNLISIRDTSVKAGAQSAAAANSQAVAGGGMTGSQRCPDGSDPNGTQTICQDPLDQGISLPNPDGSCPIAMLPVSVPNGGKCANGASPTVTMPSIVSGKMLTSGIDAGPKLIAAANSIAGILNSIASSLLTSIAQEVIGTVTKDVNGVLSGGPGNSGGLLSIAPNSLTPPVSQLPAGSAVQCMPSPFQGTIDPTTGQSVVDLNAYGGATDVQCAADKTKCSPGENIDGSPKYTWTAPGAVAISGGTDPTIPFVATYKAVGSYSVTVVASTDKSSSVCQIVIAPAPTAPTTTITSGASTTIIIGP